MLEDSETQRDENLRLEFIKLACDMSDDYKKVLKAGTSYYKFIKNNSIKDD